jgi:DNA polymerase
MPLSSSGVQVGNRPPTEEEMTYCSPYFRAQLDIVKPEVIVALGSTATQGLLGFGTFKTLGEIRGRWKQFAETPVIVTYHPSYILRNPTNRSKRAIWEDLLKVMERLALPISEKQRGFFLDK